MVPIRSDDVHMQFCKNYAVDCVSDLGYFLQMVENLGSRAQIAEGTSVNLQAAVDTGMGNANVSDVFDYFRTPEKKLRR